MIARCPNCNTTISTRSTHCPECRGRLRLPGHDMARAVFAMTFVAFNGLMLAWVGFYMTTGRISLRTADIEATGDMAGAPVAGGAGLGFLLILWLAGLLVLGLCAAFNLAHRSVKDGRHVTGPLQR